ncbi:uncharacterized protein LOC111942158 [Cyanistes caeruleus]|uniref:uncharacterized protein LOC111942158 n=1 Tax=Cyanistes caeruleus TaxID=156563 RepID=UPI000CDA2515|nr:uncharacterized protein LOC111942158 [Cyanistes caeruleus]XP_023801111.1 uncharacterized protein LOC111942158 [Cyanistes caeruleus]
MRAPERQRPQPLPVASDPAGTPRSDPTLILEESCVPPQPRCHSAHAWLLPVFPVKLPSWPQSRLLRSSGEGFGGSRRGTLTGGSRRDPKMDPEWGPPCVPPVSPCSAGPREAPEPQHSAQQTPKGAGTPTKPPEKFGEGACGECPGRAKSPQLPQSDLPWCLPWDGTALGKGGLGSGPGEVGWREGRSRRRDRGGELRKEWDKDRSEDGAGIRKEEEWDPSQHNYRVLAPSPNCWGSQPSLFLYASTTSPLPLNPRVLFPMLGFGISRPFSLGVPSPFLSTQAAPGRFSLGGMSEFWDLWSAVLEEDSSVWPSPPCCGLSAAPHTLGVLGFPSWTQGRSFPSRSPMPGWGSRPGGPLAAAPEPLPGAPSAAAAAAARPGLPKALSKPQVPARNPQLPQTQHPPQPLLVPPMAVAMAMAPHVTGHVPPCPHPWLCPHHVSILALSPTSPFVPVSPHVFRNGHVPVHVHVSPCHSPCLCPSMSPPMF